MASPVRQIQKTFYVAFLPFLAIFLGIVALGYYFSFKNNYPGINPFVLSILIAAIVVLVYGSLIHTARAFGGGSDDKSLVIRSAGVFFFLIMLALSAYGVFTALMLVFEGPVIVRESLTNARDAINRFEQESVNALRVPEYEALQTRVATAKERLNQEIGNPLLCGVGPNARAAIADIQRDLPGVALLAGSDRAVNCNDRGKLEELRRSYAILIERALQEHPLSRRFRLPERQRALADIRAESAADTASLDKALGEMQTVNNFALRLDIPNEIGRLLHTIGSRYSARYQRVASLIEIKTMNVVARIETDFTQRITSAVQILNTLIERSDRATTYLYMFAAFMTDLAAALLTANVMSIHRWKDGLRGESDIDQSGVTYIWHPASRPSADI